MWGRDKWRDIQTSDNFFDRVGTVFFANISDTCAKFNYQIFGLLGAPLWTLFAQECP